MTELQRTAPPFPAISSYGLSTSQHHQSAHHRDDSLNLDTSDSLPLPAVQLTVRRIFSSSHSAEVQAKLQSCPHLVPRTSANTHIHQQRTHQSNISVCDRCSLILLFALRKVLVYLSQTSTASAPDRPALCCRSVCSLALTSSLDGVYLQPGL